MRKLNAADLTYDFQECTFANALELCKGYDVVSECGDEWLLIRFANNFQIGIKSGDEAVRYSDVTPDLNYDPPHVYVRMIEQVKPDDAKPKYISRTKVPFFDNKAGE